MTIVVVSGLPLAEIQAHGGLPEEVMLLSKPIDFRQLQTIANEVWSTQLALKKPITP